MALISSGCSRIGSGSSRPPGWTRQTAERARASAAKTMPSSVQRIGGGGAKGNAPLCGVRSLWVRRVCTPLSRVTA